MKSAKEMFEELGLQYIECRYKGNIIEISCLDKNNKFASQVEFNLESKRYRVWFIDDDNNRCSGLINLKLHKAIQKQIEELKW